MYWRNRGHDCRRSPCGVTVDGGGIQVGTGLTIWTTGVVFAGGGVPYYGGVLGGLLTASNNYC